MAGRKLMIGPSVTLHGGWQLVILDTVRQYGAKKIYLAASTAAIVTLSMDLDNYFSIPSGQILELEMDGGPLTLTKGEELVTTGNFATATGNNWWNYRAAANGTGWNIGSGVAHHRGGTGTAAPLGQTLSVEEDGIYEVKMSITKWGTGGTGPLKVSLAGKTLAGTGPTGIRSIDECIKADDSTGPLRISGNSTGFDGTIDNVSVKKITGDQLLFAKGSSGVVLQVLFTI